MNNIYSLNQVIQQVSINLGAETTKGTIDGSTYELAVYRILTQTWSSTACGFGGIAGQAVTKAFTVIMKNESTGNYYVFVNGQYAYAVKGTCTVFKYGLHTNHIAGYTDRKVYDLLEK
jgi:hypothetical protein